MANQEQFEEQFKIDLKAAEEYCKTECDKWPLNNSFHGRMRGAAFNKIETVKADYQRKIKNWSKVVPLLKKAGLPIAKSHTTAIKGYKDYNLGFKINSDSDGVRIYFQSQGHTSTGTYRELTMQQKQQAVEVLIKAGYVLDVNERRIEILSFNW